MREESAGRGQAADRGGHGGSTQSGSSEAGSGASRQGAGRQPSDASAGSAGVADRASGGAGGGVSLEGVVDKEYRAHSLNDILDAPVSALHGLSEGDAQRLREAFNIRTVRDLATNKFFVRAQAIHLLAEGGKR